MSLLRQLVLPAVFPGVRAYAGRWVILVFALPVFTALQLVHTAALLLDEILFTRYRQVVLRRPVFILGVPRSGTTHTHHLLANDPRFTTLTLWECLFAPSVTERHLYSMLSALDHRLGSPLRSLLSWLERRPHVFINDIHPTGLLSPEEDFLLLTHTLDCFLLVLVFPECRWLWNLSRGDLATNTVQSAKLLKRYRRLLQRHLYFHGVHLQLLSKNASFSGLAHSLVAEFPDSLLLVCERDAELAVCSQLRSLQAVRRLFCTDKLSPGFETQLLDTLHFYYENLQSLRNNLPENQRISVPLWRLSRQPRAMFRLIYEQLGLGSVRNLDGVLSALESAQQTRPMTRCKNHDTPSQNSTELLRFANWRHVPEHRL